MKNKLNLLLLMSSLSLMILLGRFILARNIIGMMLVWNLFLAWIPLGVAVMVEKLWRHRFIRKTGVAIGIIAWLLFFPNAPYLITDLIHLRASPEHMVWYDALMGFSFALSGLLTGFYSVLTIHRLIDKIWKNTTMAWLAICSSLMLSSYGIYLGRFGRWNSWDVLTNPFSLVKYCFYSLHEPLAIKTTIVFSFVMLTIYGVFWLSTNKKLQ